MILINKKTDKIYKVYSKTNFNNVYVYYTNEGYISSDEDFIELGEFYKKVFSEFKGIQTISESEYINSLYIYSDYICDFESEDQKKEYLMLKNELNKILADLNDVIDMEYVIWKIKNNMLDEWKNNFEDKIIELSKTERFIDDDNYDIFYDINNLDNIKVIKKM